MRLAGARVRGIESASNCSLGSMWMVRFEMAYIICEDKEQGGGLNGWIMRVEQRRDATR
jgi:hypothetical protein